MIKKTYKTDSERIELIEGMVTAGMTLKEDAIRVDGNFMLFISPEETEPYILEPSPPEPTELELLQADLDATKETLNFVLMNF